MHGAQHIPSYIQAVEPIIRQYGYWAIGAMLFLEDFGVLVPGETVLIASAFYAGLGQLNIFLVIAIGVVASIVGDNVGFAIGNYGGHPLVEKYGKYVFLTKERLDKAESYFNRHGGKIVAVARFFDGLRELNGIIAGISEMKWGKFLIFNIIGAITWVVFWSLVGYYGGSHIDTFLTVELYFTIAVVTLVIIRFILKRYKKKKSGQYKEGDTSS